MVNIFEFEFMRRAMIVGLLLALILPMMGLQLIVKRLSLMGDAISHSALAGVVIGLVLGLNPTITTLIITIVAALAIELVRKKIPHYSELALAIILSTSLGVAGILSSFVKGAANLDAFLFGSIIAISDVEFYSVVGVSLTVFLISMLLYKQFFNTAFDVRSAKLQGIKVDAINILFTVMTAITIAIASRTIGALIVSSIMIVPVAGAMQLSKSYKGVMGLGVLLSMIYVMVGLVVSFYLGLKPGATIVLLASFGFIVIVVLKQVFKRVGE